MLIVLVVLAVLAGVAVKVALDRAGAGSRVSRGELLIGALVCGIAVIPLALHVGDKVAVNNLLSYQEYWNGYERSADVKTVTCTRDGSCRHTYECDPYTVFDTETYTDSDGNTRTRTVTRTEYHDCPYVDREFTYTVDTTLGRFTVASHVFPDDPQRHAWRAGKRVPSHFPSGVPALWEQARQRIAAGEPGPVTARRDYDNYLLASQASILRRFSSAKDRLLDAGLLPKPATGVHDLYQADKVYAVGGATVPPGFQRAVSRLNAALGTERQGDLHVLIAGPEVGDPSEYIGALTAYWQGKELGKNGASKNTIMLVLGTDDGRTVKWARAATGMPVGNEQVLRRLRDELPGQPLDARRLFGQPRAKVPADGGDPTVTNTEGAVERVLFAPDGFKRVCMTCDDAGETGGFAYLKGEIEPTSGQKLLIGSVSFLLCLLVWGGVAALPDRFTDPLSRLLGKRR